MKIEIAKRILTKASELLAAEAGFVVATITGHAGSLPRGSGTQMIITGDGALTGTIGGGLFEARVTRAAVKLLQQQGGAEFIFYDSGSDNADGLDMGCGGQAEVFLDPIRPAGETGALFDHWQRVLERKEKGFFITAVFGGRDCVERVAHAVMANGKVLGNAGALPVALVEKIGHEADQAASLKILPLDDVLVIVQPAVTHRRAFLFGAGHVAKYTAHLCALIGLHVTVRDDREAFATTDNFPDSHEVTVLPNFDNAFADLQAGPGDFVVIFTRGHLSDKIVLGQALRTGAGYIGMIGSQKKRAAIYKALLDEDCRQEDLDRVHCPIGLAIGAQSPEEIAVSIVSEMIQERAGMQPG